MGQREEKLFTALARKAEQCLSEFNTQDLATTAWSFAKVSQRDAQLFMALARTAEQRLGRFNARELTNTA